MSTPPPPGAEDRALRLAKHIVGHDDTTESEDRLARGLIAEQKLTEHLRRELAALREGAPT